MMSLAQRRQLSRKAAPPRSNASAPRSAFGSLVGLALLLTAPCELLLFGLFAYPVDTGITPDTPLHTRILCDLSLLVHWPGLLLFDWLIDRHASAGVELLTVFSIGYIDLFLLVLALAVFARWLLHRFRRRSA